eukprot:6417451-Amphidinium_carterae.1
MCFGRAAGPVRHLQPSPGTSNTLGGSATLARAHKHKYVQLSMTHGVTTEFFVCSDTNSKFDICSERGNLLDDTKCNMEEPIASRSGSVKGGD